MNTIESIAGELALERRGHQIDGLDLARKPADRLQYHQGISLMKLACKMGFYVWSGHTLIKHIQTERYIKME